MKRRFAVLLALLMLLAGCGQGKAPANHVTDYDVSIPEGFEARSMEGFEFVYYNEDGSSVNMNLTEKDGNTDSEFATITAGDIKSTLVDTFKSLYGVEPVITDRSFTKEPVGGLAAYQYSYVIELAGIGTQTQLIVCINADQIYTITYTDASGDWIGTFEDSAANIQLTLE